MHDIDRYGVHTILFLFDQRIVFLHRILFYVCFVGLMCMHVVNSAQHPTQVVGMIPLLAYQYITRLLSLHCDRPSIGSQTQGSNMENLLKSWNCWVLKSCQTRNAHCSSQSLVAERRPRTREDAMVQENEKFCFFLKVLFTSFFFMNPMSEKVVAITDT